MIATIGFFDGLHEGHRYVLSQVIKLAKERGDGSVVFTFKNHPASLFAPDRVPPMLLTAEEKEERLTALGVERIVMLDFNKELASLSAADFLDFMKKRYGVTTLLLGYDNHFGKKEHTADGKATERSFEDYIKLGKEAGIEVLKLQEFRTFETLNPRNLEPSKSRNLEPSKPRELEASESRNLKASKSISSSTLIRNLLLNGDISEANQRLGYNYFIEGEVVHGKQIGREIGFPTANINPPAQKLIPKRGVYAARVELKETQVDEDTAQIDGKAAQMEEEAAQVEWKTAVVNIGTCPTFNGEESTIEAHIIDFQSDLYGKKLRIEFVKRLRDEQKFDSKSQLIAQINKDKEKAIGD